MGYAACSPVRIHELRVVFEQCYDGGKAIQKSFNERHGAGRDRVVGAYAAEKQQCTAMTAASREYRIGLLKGYRSLATAHFAELRLMNTSRLLKRIERHPAHCLDYEPDKALVNRSDRIAGHIWSPAFGELIRPSSPR